MNINFIHNNENTNLLNFIKSNENITIYELTNFNITNTDKNIINIYSDLFETKLLKNAINILIIYDTLFDSKLLDKYDFFIPTSPSIYYNLLSSLGLKILLPINFNENEIYKWGTYYCSDITFRKIKPLISNISNIINFDLHRESISKCNIAFYSEINELKKLSINNNTIIQHYTKDLQNVIYFLKLIQTCYNNKQIFTSSCEYKFIGITNYSDNFNLQKDNLYLIARYGFNMFKNNNLHIIAQNYLAYNINNVAFFSDGQNDLEFVIMIKPFDNILTNMNELLKKVDYIDNRIIGINSKKLSGNEAYELYKIYGLNKIKIPYIEDIKYIYMDVLISLIKNIKIIDNQLLNPYKFIRIASYWSSENCYELQYYKVKRFISSHPEYFTQKTILLLSKKIISYGGNQKTSLQIYKELLIEGYDVKIGCIDVKTMVKSIDRDDIINFSTCKLAYEETQKNKYFLIIVNKLDNILDYCKNQDNRIIFITHNSMDPINSILKNTTIIQKYGIENKIRKILTVNQFHISNLYDGKLTVPVTDYYNYNNNNIYNQDIIIKDNMTRIITYIGRISNEKNINMLIDAFINICNNDNDNDNDNDNNKKIKLVIIGNGNLTQIKTNKHPQIIFTGSLDYDGIVSWLSRSDFLVSTTSTEGLPFSYLESMSLGIPIITPNIVGCNELIDSTRGILYDYIDYDIYKNKNNWDIFKLIKLHYDKNTILVKNALQNAFTMDIEKWNKLSKNCVEFYNKYYKSDKLFNHNINSLLTKNSILIITNDVDEFFMKQFPLLDFVSNYDSNCDDYDIIIKIDNFDILTKKFSLFKTPQMVSRNIENMNNFINILYKIRKECRDKGINKIFDIESNIKVKFPSIKIFNTNNKEIFNLIL